MKRLVLPIVFVLVGFVAFKNPETKSFVKFAKFQWEATEYDFGQIEQNIPVTHEFTFTNNGEVPLIISNVKGSCGCTVTDYSKEPIPPGKTGIVKATYNAKSMGQFYKSITVTANVEGGPERLYIKGEVVKAEE